ncbi:MAG: GtrA family protein [Dehalococcoidia bacterium]|nr:GtrA family protein [Dehalococcoidia bacterium]
MISLVATARSGREDISSLAEQIDRALEGYEYELILVADDGTDGAAKIAESLSQKYPIKVVRYDGKGGSALVAGLNEARGEVIGVIEADLQHSAEKIPQLLKALEDGADIAIASRYIPGGGIEGWSRKRRAISRGATMLARLALPSVRKVKDPMSGFFLLRRKVMEGTGHRPIGHGILLGTLAGAETWEVREVPYVEDRMGDEGHFSLGDELKRLAHIFILATTERELRRLIQFALVGLSGVGVNFGAFWLLTRAAGLPDLVALLLGWATATLSNFILNDIWTFRDRRVGNIKATLVRALKFNLISVGAVGLYYASYTPLTRFLEVYDLVAYAIAIGIGLVWNFSMNVLWTWRKGTRHAL